MDPLQLALFDTVLKPFILGNDIYIYYQDVLNDTLRVDIWIVEYQINLIIGVLNVSLLCSNILSVLSYFSPVASMTIVF